MGNRRAEATWGVGRLVDGRLDRSRCLEGGRHLGSSDDLENQSFSEERGHG